MQMIRLIHYATLPAAGALLCVLAFTALDRNRARRMLLSLSAGCTLTAALKALCRVPRPWLTRPEAAPLTAEGGYAFPCLHTAAMAAVLSSLALSSRRRWVKPLCAAGCLGIALFRALTGLQSFADVVAGLLIGLLCAWLMTTRHRWNASIRWTLPFLIAAGLAAAILTRNAWGLGLSLTATGLTILEPVYARADSCRTRFGKIYGTLLAAGIYAGIYIFLPFLIEWLLTPLWPGQTLIIFLLTLLPVLPALLPVF